MASVSRVTRVKQNETDIAVLQVQVESLNEKVDDLKIELQDLRETLSKCSQQTHHLIEEMQRAAEAAHKALERKVSNLEKWRWMIMGAGITLGAFGFDAMSKLFAIG